MSLFYFSGGNKRKLNTAAALVGDPPIVFLVSCYLLHETLIFFSNLSVSINRYAMYTRPQAQSFVKSRCQKLLSYK